MSKQLPQAKQGTKPAPRTVKLSLLSYNADAKTAKGNGLDSDYLTSILYLAPATTADGEINLCAWASEGCLLGCLFTAGRAAFTPNIIKARIRKTLYYLRHKVEFMHDLLDDLARFQVFCAKHRKRPAYRLDGTSDISIASRVARKFPLCQFYDYTKSVRRVLTNRHANLYLTFSRSEVNEADCLTVLKAGHSVAVVFRKELPAFYLGYPVIDGDKTDRRFLDRKMFNIADGKGFIVGLKAKGKAKKDRTGFVVDLH